MLVARKEISVFITVRIGNGLFVNKRLVKIVKEIVFTNSHLALAVFVTLLMPKAGKESRADKMLQ